MNCEAIKKRKKANTFFISLQLCLFCLFCLSFSSIFLFVILYVLPSSSPSVYYKECNCFLSWFIVLFGLYSVFFCPLFCLFVVWSINNEVKNKFWFCGLLLFIILKTTKKWISIDELIVSTTYSILINLCLHKYVSIVWQNILQNLQRTSSSLWCIVDHLVLSITLNILHINKAWWL